MGTDSFTRPKCITRIFQELKEYDSKLEENSRILDNKTKEIAKTKVFGNAMVLGYTAKTAKKD